MRNDIQLFKIVSLEKFTSKIDQKIKWGCMYAGVGVDNNLEIQKPLIRTEQLSPLVQRPGSAPLSHCALHGSPRHQEPIKEHSQERKHLTCRGGIDGRCQREGREEERKIEK